MFALGARPVPPVLHPDEVSNRNTRLQQLRLMLHRTPEEERELNMLIDQRDAARVLIRGPHLPPPPSEAETNESNQYLRLEQLRALPPPMLTNAQRAEIERGREILDGRIGRALLEGIRFG
jgi:hypothetical protein